MAYVGAVHDDAGQKMLSTLGDTMLKLKADQQRLGKNTGRATTPGSPRKEWTYNTDPPDLRGVANTSLVQVLVGPVVGTVTQTSAVVLLEVDIAAAVTLIVCFAGDDIPVIRMQRRMPARRPVVFTITGLHPASSYSVSFEGLAMTELQGLPCSISTLPPDDRFSVLRVIALSGDNLGKLRRKEENPWNRLATLPEASRETTTLCLHLGGQVHAAHNGAVDRARRILKDHDTAPAALACKLRERAMERLQETYRDTWTEESTRVVMAKWQRMVAWSDADIADEFTTLSNEQGQQAYDAEFLKCSMRCYRLYQRQLWDPDGEGALPPIRHPMEEWQFRRFGPVGVFVVDIRGHRISSSGQVADPETPLLCERQRNAILAALLEPGMHGLIVASELPLAVEEPAVLRTKLEEQPSLAYLKDQWTYHTEDQHWLLDAVFDWRAGMPGREALFLCGGTNCGVESTIHCKRTGATIRQVTTSPMTNLVSPCEAPQSGEISMRYFFHHKALGQYRNYCEVRVTVNQDVCTMVPELVGVPAQKLEKQDRLGIEIGHAETVGC